MVSFLWGGFTREKIDGQLQRFDWLRTSIPPFIQTLQHYRDLIRTLDPESTSIYISFSSEKQ